ncbi:MAG: protease modulator HflC [Alphaproteobacteria bacterium]|nr:protease modulator HflC [Alphaproteobacteria bacterium]
MTPKQIFTAVLIFFAYMLASDSIFVVNQQQQALVLQFRDVVRVIQNPGLNFKIPVFQTVEFFDKRVLPLEAPEQEAILADQKRIVVDAFARYRITDPLKYFQRLNNERNTNDQLSILVNSSMRQILGTLSMTDVLSSKRAKIMLDIRDEMNAKAKSADYGVEIVDVRIRSANLPDETSQSIFARMISERKREAAEFRAKGQELSQEIKSKAEREKTVLLAEAQREAETTRGQGDQEALHIIAQATSKDAQFYNFYRSLQAYRDTMANKETSIILSPDSDFFKYFGKVLVK